jgi:hypothetical protein
MTCLLPISYLASSLSMNVEVIYSFEMLMDYTKLHSYNPENCIFLVAAMRSLYPI